MRHSSFFLIDIWVDRRLNNRCFTVIITVKQYVIQLVFNRNDNRKNSRYWGNELPSQLFRDTRKKYREALH